MISLRHLTLIVFCSLFGGLLFAADAGSASATTKNASSTDSLAGKFVGTWGNGTDGGQLRIKLTQDASVWSAEVSFTVGEALVPGKVVSLAVAGQKLEMVVDWQLDGSSGQSRITGELSGDKLEGLYDSKTSDGTSNGTWSVTRA